MRLRRLETACWAIGLMLLAAYGVMRGWYSYSSAAGIAAFDAVRGAPRTLRSADPLPAATSGSPVIGQVDTSAWSSRRVAHYHRAQLEARAPIAVLRMPALALTVPVYEGTSEYNLNRGAGRIEGTARIGTPGNVGIAAHRDGFFRALKDVQIGQLLYLDQVATTATYRVVATQVTEPSDVRVLHPTPAASVTLVTCYPFYYVGAAPRRFIVRAQLTTGDGPSPAPRPPRAPGNPTMPALAGALP